MKKKKKQPILPPSSAPSSAAPNSITPSKSREKLLSAKAFDAALELSSEDLCPGDVNTEEVPPSAEEIAVLEAINEVVNDSSQQNTAAKPSTTSDLGLLAEIM
jgi:hypothetical protein